MRMVLSSGCDVTHSRWITQIASARNINDKTYLKYMNIGSQTLIQLWHPWSFYDNSQTKYMFRAIKVGDFAIRTYS